MFEYLFFISKAIGYFFFALFAWYAFVRVTLIAYIHSLQYFKRLKQKKVAHDAIDAAMRQHSR